MKTTYKTVGYELTAASKSRIYTHAVIFTNTSNDRGLAATFHASLELAEKEMKRMAKIDWLVPSEIVAVEAIN